MGYKVWPSLAMAYVLAIRTVELINIERLLKVKKLQLLFLGVFLPTFTAWLALGVYWWIEAIKSDCVRGFNFDSYRMRMIVSLTLW
jgi:hypothetical protein